MADIKDLAISYWRLERWITNAPVEKKMAANSALRNIKKYLDAESIKIVDPVGQPYDIGMSVDVVHNNLHDGTDENQGIVSETIKPIIYQNDSVLEFGQIVLGDSVKEIKEQPKLPEIPEIAEKKEPLPIEITSKDSSNKLRILITSGIAALNIGTIILLCILFTNANTQMKSIKNEIGSQNDYVTTDEMKTYTEKEASSASETSDKIDAMNGKLDDSTKQLENIKTELEDIKGKLAEEGTSNSDKTLIRYEVQSGDSLYKICQDKGLCYSKYKDEIIQFNNLDDPNRLSVGQVLYLPKIDD